MRPLLASFAVLLVIAGFAGAQPNPTPLPEYATLGETTLGAFHGVNLGNFLEAPMGAFSRKVIFPSSGRQASI